MGSSAVKLRISSILIAVGIALVPTKCMYSSIGPSGENVFSNGCLDKKSEGLLAPGWYLTVKL